MSDADTVKTIVTVATAITKDGLPGDIKGAVSAFQNEGYLAQAMSIIIILDDAGKVAGIFFPPAAVVASDLGIAIAIEQALQPYIEPVVDAAVGQAVLWVKGAIGDLASRSETANLHAVEGGGTFLALPAPAKAGPGEAMIWGQPMSGLFND